MSDERQIEIYNKLVEENRIGRFSISRGLICRYGKAEWLLKLFGNFIVVRADSDFPRDCVDYTAFSPLFDKSPLNAEPQFYNIEITVEPGESDQDDEVVSFKANLAGCDSWKPVVTLEQNEHLPTAKT